MNTTSAVIPSHVPPHLVHDVDPFNLEGGTEDAHAAWKQVQARMPDVYFTPRYGGYWVLNRAALLTQVWRDPERFASSGAISVPPLPPGFLLPPIDTDPPHHRHFRLPISMALSPARVHDLRSEARALACELIQELKPRGECEFIQDFAMHLPMTIFLRLVDLPLSDRTWLIARAEVMTRSQDLERRTQAYTEILEYLESKVQERRANPGKDLISEITRIKVGDRPITHAEVLGECSQALFGGLDTVAGTMGFFARFLAENPMHRQQLIDNPALIPDAIEEMMRRFSIPLVSRRVTQDLELGGVQMKAGDLVILETCMHGLDERAWLEPMTVDFKRCPRDHMAFGTGIHKCPGANLARSELAIFLEEWLKRIPHFNVKPGDRAVTACGAVLGMLRLPLVWPT